MQATLEVHLHRAQDGSQRLYLHHLPPPGTAARGFLVYVHPWAEEMNKSRRMAAIAARSLAARGMAVLQIDLAGCGDSSGDFGDASWQTWLDDVDAAISWMSARHAGAAVWLWGLRVGALLCTQVAARRDEAIQLLLWHPVTDGRLALQQFLRLRAAASLASGNAKAVMDALRNDLAAGRPVEVAGYTLQPSLAEGLTRARLTPVEPRGTASLVWLETHAQSNVGNSPAQTAGTANWQAAGWQVIAETVQGPAFWQTTEIEDAPGLVAATVKHVSALTGGP